MKMVRKSYDSPKLTAYGDFKSLTNGTKGGKKKDNVGKMTTNSKN